MSDEEEMDRRLRALLRQDGPAPGDLFVLKVERRIEAEMRLDAARRLVWRRALTEALATAAVLAAFIFLGRLAPEIPADGLTLASPAMAAVLVAALWLTIELRPANAR
jgi:hypothetical protein